MFEQLLSGENPGTHFIAQQGATRARKHWLKHTLKSNGKVMLDMGAVSALTEKGASLLPSGISEVSGNFKVGDCIDVYDGKNQQPIAKGISQYNYRDLKRIQGKKSDEIATLLGCCPSKVVIHRDDMVVLAKSKNY